MGDFVLCHLPVIEQIQSGNIKHNIGWPVDLFHLSELSRKAGDGLAMSCDWYRAAHVTAAFVCEL